MAYSRLSPQQVAQARELASRLGSLRLRSIVTDPQSRLMRPERLERWSKGQGKISPEEAEILESAYRNRAALARLGDKQTTDEKKGRKRRPYKVNHALRDWVRYGKERGVDYRKQDHEERNRQLRAIKALRFLGVNPSEGRFYVKKTPA